MTGVLVPIPQYPLYTATLAVLNAKCVPYYLDESKNWGTDISAIKEAYKKAKVEGIDVRAIVIINPGNPTGASLPEGDIKAAIDFAAKEKLVVMADEVYQTNVFIGKFHSFKGVLRTMQKENPGKYDSVELASLHSTSKGMVGECGHRGGYFELVGFDKEVQGQIYKFVSIMLCAPVIGQCLVELMVNPPKEGDESYELYKQEYHGIFQGLKDRATALYEAFKEMEGVECQIPQVCHLCLLIQPHLLYPHASMKPLTHTIPLGLHVPLPHHPPPTQSHRASRSREAQPRRILRFAPLGRDGRLRRAGFGLRPETKHAALPDDVFGAWDGVGGAHYEVS
jgi:aspartate/methionine/tyrosine aminotransferase